MTKEDVLLEIAEPISDGWDGGWDSEGVYKAMDQYAKQQAILFAEFLHPSEDYNWQMYDGADRWINLRNNEVKSTTELYNLFLQSIKQ